MGVAAGAWVADATATSLAVGDAAWAAGSCVATAIGVGAAPAEVSGLAAAVAGTTTAALGALLADEFVVEAAAPEQAARSKPKSAAAAMPRLAEGRVLVDVISL